MTLQLHVKISTLYTKLKSQRRLGTDYMEIFYPVMKFQLGSPSLDFYDYKKTTQRDNRTPIKINQSQAALKRELLLHLNLNVKSSHSNCFFFTQLQGLTIFIRTFIEGQKRGAFYFSP